MRGSQPGAPQRPKTFDGLHLGCMNPLVLSISGGLASTMANGSMCIAPFLESCMGIFAQPLEKVE
jgi:hypothetical protein